MDTIRKNDGTWIQTYQGQAFWPTEPLPRDVDIHDIAHALALSCRWTGHVYKHYSVAQHSVHVAQLVELWLTAQGAPSEMVRLESLKALLHDASEAYISDIARPTKPKLTNYYEIEAKLMEAILAKYQLTPEDWPTYIKDADDALLMAEARDLMRAPPMPWTYVPGSAMTWPWRIKPWSPAKAELEFLVYFARYTDTLGPTLKKWAQIKWYNFRYFGLFARRPG